jgi:hypothetical protein
VDENPAEAAFLKASEETAPSPFGPFMIGGAIPVLLLQDR